jgi:hypothetical protein
MEDPVLLKHKAKLLQRRPVLEEGFRLIRDWKTVRMTAVEKKAEAYFLEGGVGFNSPLIREERNPAALAAYLRYDFKKVLIRTRQVYIDNHFVAGEDMAPPLIGFGFYEPLLLGLCYAETLGQYWYPERNALSQILTNLGSGYGPYARKLRNYFRNGLAHHFRPFGEFFIDLNTSIEYSPPSRIKIGENEIVKIDIPHFLDSLAVETERALSRLGGDGHRDWVERYLRYLERRKLSTAKMHLEDARRSHAGPGDANVEREYEQLMHLFDIQGKSRQKKRYQKRLKKIHKKKKRKKS